MEMWVQEEHKYWDHGKKCDDKGPIIYRDLKEELSQAFYSHTYKEG